MSQPQAYDRATSFTNLQAVNPTGQPPGSLLDAEFNNIKTTLDQIRGNLALVQRDDGALKNESVGRYQLSPQVSVGFSVPTAWLTGTAYVSSPASTVFNGGKFYSCLVSHTSGTFATDLAAAKWVLIADLTAVPLVTASQIAVTADGGLVSSDVQTSLNAIDAGKAATSHTHTASAISDSTSAGRAVLTAANVAAQQSLLGINSVGFQSGQVVGTYAFALPSGWYWCNGAEKSRSGDAALFAAITITQNGTLSSGSAVVTALSDTSNMSPGMPLSGVNVPAATTILSVDSATQITMSANATGTATTPICVAPHGVGDGSTTFNLPQLSGVGLVGRETMGGVAAVNVAQVSTTITTSAASPTTTVASAAGLFVGMYATSAKIPSGTKILTISGTTVTLDTNATAISTGVAVRFSALRDAQTLGATGGSISQTQISAEMPAHTHVATDSGHTHAQSADTILAGAGATQNGRAAVQANATGGVTASGTANITNANTGGGAPHANVQPSRTVNYIIKA